MKILFIANNQTNDFLSDAVFHGMKSLPNLEVIDYNRLWYMYNDIDTSTLVNRFHGRGFTYYASLPEGFVNRMDIVNQIKEKRFDKVVYGNIRRCLDLFDLVESYYDKDSIILLDGNDEHNQPGIWSEYVNNGVYYRRELSKEEKELHPSVKPISFAFPANKILAEPVEKKKVLAQIIPGVMHTFTYNDEQSYFMDYQTSLFGYTWRKAGWDCLRHYEIICNNCMPLFLDIHECPDTICTTIPKKLLMEYYDISGITELFDLKNPVTYDDKRCIITNKDLSLINKLDINDSFFRTYFEYLTKLTEYARQHLTTKALAQYLIQ